jgi:hypothetical protein
MERARVARKIQARRDRVQRPTEKACEWDECPVVFPLASTGVRPKYCPEHRKMDVAPRAQAATIKWRQQTLSVECEHPICGNLQHPSGQGWCYFHYPILSVHGLNAKGWWRFYNEQNGICPVCLLPLLDGRTIAVDHDHVTSGSNTRHDVEHVRGLLHAAPCNGVIVGGIETAIRNGWLDNVWRYIKFLPSESN